MKKFIIPALLACLFSCSKKQEETKQDLPEELQEVYASAYSEDVPNDFKEFLHKFSSDSLYQRERVAFPLKFTHAGFEAEKDSTFTVIEKVYTSVDLVNPGPDHFGRPTEVKTKMTDDNNATVTVSGPRTSIHIEFLFELINDEWTLREVIDSSE
jgi:hypothetical protein